MADMDDYKSICKHVSQINAMRPLVELLSIEPEFQAIAEKEPFCWLVCKLHEDPEQFAKVRFSKAKIETLKNAMMMSLLNLDVALELFEFLRSNDNALLELRTYETFCNKAFQSHSRRICERISEETISFLKSSKDCTLSGDDSPLTNAWEEVCVQIQYEHSLYWDVYLDTIENFISPLVEALSDLDRLAICSQIYDYELTNYDSHESFIEDAAESCKEIMQFILNEYVLSDAGNFRNQNIEDYIYQQQ